MGLCVISAPTAVPATPEIQESLHKREYAVDESTVCAIDLSALCFYKRGVGGVSFIFFQSSDMS